MTDTPNSNHPELSDIPEALSEPKRRFSVQLVWIIPIIAAIIGLSLGGFVMFFLLLSRLWYLQVVDTDNLMDQSENNRLRFVPVAAPLPSGPK